VYVCARSKKRKWFHSLRNGILIVFFIVASRKGIETFSSILCIAFHGKLTCQFFSDYIWIEPVTGTEFDVAIGARVTSAEGRRIQVKDDDGVEQWLSPERRIKAMHASSVQGVEDMISLGDLHEAGILRNLLIRYNDNLIYVSCTRHSALFFPFSAAFVQIN
jgi:hypothetical protein